MKNNSEKGNIGEKIAVLYLTKKSHTILELNYRNRYGEIDIISSDEEYIVFVEVKYRKNCEQGLPRESVDYRKQNKIKNIALNYISENNLDNSNFRFDVVEVLGTKELSVEHIKNAFC